MRENQDFTRGSILKKMLLFMFPILGSLILQAMYGAVDLFIIGQYGTSAGISGVSTGTNIMNTVTVVFNSLVMGVTVMMGRFLGERRNDKIGPLIGSSICFFGALGVVFSILLFIFSRQIAVLMQAPMEAVELTSQYIRICGTGTVFIVAYNYISAIFRGMGNSKLPLYFVVVATVANMIGDYVLVKIFGLNVAGAAIATVAAQALSVIFSMFVIVRSDLPFSMSKKDLHFGSEIREFVAIGMPLTIQQLLTSVSFLAICAFVNAIGLDASSGYGVAQRIQQFILLFPSALSQTLVPFVSQNVGAKNEKRAKKALFTGISIGVCVGTFVALTIFYKGDLLASIFTDDPVVIRRAFEYLRGFSSEAIITCIMFSFLSYFNGHSLSKFVSIQGIIQSICIRLPVSYFMSRIPGVSLTYIGLAVPCATVVGIGMCLMYYRYINKNIINED